MNFKYPRKQFKKWPAKEDSDQSEGDIEEEDEFSVDDLCALLKEHLDALRKLSTQLSELQTTSTSLRHQQI